MKFTPVVLALSAALLTLSSTAHAFDAKPRMVGKAVPAALSLAPAQTESTADVQTERRIERRLSQAGSDYIKVRFSDFQLPAGAYVLVSSADGQEVHRYDAQQRNNRTYDRLLGEDGQNRFSAMSVFGDTAVVTLVLPRGVAWGASHKIKVDQFHAGNMTQPQAESGMVRPMSVCGTDERKDAVCFASSNAAEYDRSRPVARLLISGSSLCTSWRVGADNRMFTNNHCFSDQASVTATEVWFNYQKSSCGGSTMATATKVTGGTLLKTDATLDYSLFTINDFSKVSTFGYLGLDVAAPVAGAKIFIAQHGGGNPKQLALTSDQNGGGQCQIDQASIAGNAADTDTAYYCDTEGGSSGSPVISSASKNAIALHHFGGCKNQGVKMSQIWPQVATHFNNVVPVGDTGTPINQAPTANFTATCTDLACSFNGSSSTDSDGTIASYAWTFGDGRTATGATATNTYAAAGSYNVTLTVTDDRGATGTKTTTVYPTIGGGFPPKTNLSAARDAWLRYTYVIPAGKTSVTFTTAGGTGDADLYLRKGAAPDKTTYGCRSWSSTNTESCTLTVTAGDTVHIGVNAYAAFSGVTLSLK